MEVGSSLWRGPTPPVSVADRNRHCGGSPATKPRHPGDIKKTRCS